MPETSEVLESIPGVNVIHRTEELEEKQAKSRIWNETWLERFFYKPCNHELFVRQTLNMEMGIAMAKDSGMDWIIHVDTDELIHPSGTTHYSIRELFLGIPDNVDTVIFPNYESCVESDDVKEPFGEVSLFKKNSDHLSKDLLYENYEDAAHGNPSYFLTYSNGKSAARVQDHLRPNGAHRWYNYARNPIQAKMKDAAILHYTYSMFSDLTSRRDRCRCKPADEVVRRCFMLDFDRAAFIMSSTAAEEEMRSWYNERVVWGDAGKVSSLLKKGILTRIYTPMAIFRVLRESAVFGSAIASSVEGQGANMPSAFDLLASHAK